MRVRKSVPEGYKTKPFSGGGQHHDWSRPSSAPLNRTTGSNNHGGFAELTPYCGILKIGGYEAQTSHHAVEECAPIQIGSDEYDFVSSQDSNTSTVSTDMLPTLTTQSTCLSKKRRYEEGDTLAEVCVWEDEESIPTSARFIAVPKTRRKVAHMLPRKDDFEVGQENSMFDFGEAEFLMAPECIEEEMELDVI